MLGLINHIPLFKITSTYKLLYISLIQPILEYAFPIWQSYKKTEITLLEQLQRKFMRKLASLHGTPMHYSNNGYSQIQSQFSIFDLNSRRKTADILFIYKILNRTIDCQNISDKFGFNNLVRNFHYNPLFHVNFSSNLKRQCSIINRLISMGNQKTEQTNIFDF